MRIALFYNLNFGGAKRAVFEQINELEKHNVKVDIYTTDTAKDIFNSEKIIGNIYCYNSDSFLLSLPFLKKFFSDMSTFFYLPHLHKKIAKDIDTKHYSLVFVHPDKFTQAPFLLKFLKTRSVYFCQEPLRIAYEYSLRFQKGVGVLKKIYEQITRFYRKVIDRQNVRSATFTLASCLHIRERMIAAYDVFPKISYLGVNSKLFKPKNLKKKNQVVFIGSKDSKIDGYDLANKALLHIPKAIRPALLVISWKKNNGERLSDEELIKIYNESLVTLCLSRLETFGLVPLESMSCGTPVIATNVSGHRETIINGKTGYLIDFDPKEIAEKIIHIIKKPVSAKTLGENARAHIENTWSWTIRGKELFDLLSFIAKTQI